MLGPQYQWTGLYTFKECFHISNLFEYFEEEELLPLESPWLRALLPLEPVLRPLLRQELLRGDKTLGKTTDREPSRELFLLLEPTCWSLLLQRGGCNRGTEFFLSLFLCLWSWRSHSSRDDTGRDEDSDLGMETPSPGTPDTPVHRWLVSNLTMSTALHVSSHVSWQQETEPEHCPSRSVSGVGGCVCPKFPVLSPWYDCPLSRSRSHCSQCLPPAPLRSPGPDATVPDCARDKCAWALELGCPDDDDEQQHMM